MIHLDLFSGIGGFALAVDEVRDDVEHIFCEIDPYCRALLKKRFPRSIIYGDIRTLSRERFVANADSDRCSRGGKKINSTETEQQTFSNTKECNVFILTGGFPCQPFSQAGKRKGKEDNRYLWPEMLRVIHSFKPTWVIAENVRGILSIEGGLVFEQVCLDLEGEGYEVQPLIIPAVAKNAPHRRDRVWFIAHGKEAKCEQRGKTWSGRGRFTDKSGYAPNTENGKSGKSTKQERREGIGRGDKNARDSQLTGLERREQLCESPGEGFSGETGWQQNWLEVAAKFCGVDDGLPAELDRLKLSKSRHQVERLKALGNAIVPQVAIEIMRAIRQTEGGNKDEHRTRTGEDSRRA